MYNNVHTIMYRLIVDNRERHVFDALKNYCKYEYTLKCMTVGDYAIMLDEGGCERIVYIIERKTWKDLSSSIKDGRIDNYKKLIDLRYNTGCRILLLIEGLPFPSEKNKIGNISAKALLSHIDHMTTRDNFGVIYTRNKEQSIKRMCALIESHKTIRWNKFTEGNTRILSDMYYHFMMFKQAFNEYSTCMDKVGGEDNLYIKHIKDDEMVQIKMLSIIPKISFNMASNIYTKYSLMDLMNQRFEKSGIAMMRHPTGTLYGEIAEKSINTLAQKCLETVSEDSKYPKHKSINRDVRVQILSQVVGISETTAMGILEKVPLSMLVQSGGELSKIVINGRKVGTKKAEDICRILSISKL